ncbi:MAG: MFS transporter [Cytophagaceae bacterium]|nr:MFS transporter [Cytophagaceae bacterium]
MSELSTLTLKNSSRLARWYPWLIVFSGLLVLIVINGLTTSSLSVFDEALTREFNLDRTQLKTKETVTLTVAAIFILLSGFLIDRIGVKKLLLTGLVFMGAALGLYGFIRAPWQLYAVHVLLGLAYVTAGSVPVIILVSTWFRAQRGLALGLTLVGTSLGSAIFPPILNQFIENEGWRTTFLLLSALPALLLVYVFLVVRDSPAQVGGLAWGETLDELLPNEDPDLLHNGMEYRQAVRTPIFWLISACGLLSFFGVLGLVSNLFLHLRGMGFEAEAAASGLSLYFVGSLTGKFLISSLSDYADIYKLFPASLVGLALGAAGLASLVPSLMPWAVGLTALSWGGVFTLYNVLIIRTFGLKSAGKINGSISFWESVGGLSGPVLTGWWFQQTGSYQQAFGFIAAMIGTAALLSLFFKRLKPV